MNGLGLSKLFHLQSSICASTTAQASISGAISYEYFFTVKQTRPVKDSVTMVSSHHFNG